MGWLSWRILLLLLLFLIKSEVEEEGRRRSLQAISCMVIPISRVLRPLHSAHHSIPYWEHQVPQKLSDTFVSTSEMFRCSVLTALRDYDGIMPFLEIIPMLSWRLYCHFSLNQYNREYCISCYLIY